MLKKNMQYGYSSLTECNFHILLNALVQYKTCQISEERIPEQSLFQHMQCSNKSCLKNKKIVDIKKKQSISSMIVHNIIPTDTVSKN